MKNMANVDGTISPLEDAKISILDRGFLYGDSVYEVFSTHNGVIHLCEEHFDRLKNSASLTKMKITQSVDFLLKEIKQTAKAANINKGEEIYIRLTVTRGTGKIDLDPRTERKTSYAIIIQKSPQWDNRFYSEGIRLAIPKIRRNSIYTLEPNIKGGNYLNNVLALGQAKELGADDALICNLDSYITECSNSNIMFLIKGELFTPDLSVGNLQGTTKNTLINICKKYSIPVSHSLLKVQDIKEAEEAFILSATRGVMPVYWIRKEDGEKIHFPSGGGTITKKLHSLYQESLTQYSKSFKIYSIFS